MATGKRYYWIKLKESFMTSDAVDYLMSQPNGANYVVLYQMLCLKTINTDGRLSRQIGEVIIPYDIPKIQRDLKWFSADTIRVALCLYQSIGLIYEDSDGTLVLSDHGNLVGSETDYAEKNRRMRTGQRNQLPPMAGDTGHNVSGDVSENVSTDIEIEKDIENRDKRLEKDGRNKKKEKADAFLDFAGADTDLLQALRDFEAMRVKIKKPMTDRAKQLLISELCKYPERERIAILENSIMHCWQGVYGLDKPNAPAQSKTDKQINAMKIAHERLSAEEQGGYGHDR